MCRLSSTRRPPARLYPAPLAHPPPFPAPGSTPDPSTSFSHPRSAHTQHLALLAHHSCLHRLLPGLHCPSFRAPSPRAWFLACGPPLTRGPLARGSHCAALPLRAPPSLLCLWHVPKRGGGRGMGERCSPGGGWRGLPAHGREEEPSLVPPRHVQRGRQVGRRGEARRKLGGGGGEAQAEGRSEGGRGAHCPSSSSPRIRAKGGGGRARGGWRIGRGEEELPGRRGLLANGKGGGTLCPPCPKHACKGGGGRAAGVGCSPRGLLPANGKEGGGA